MPTLAPPPRPCPSPPPSHPPRPSSPSPSQPTPAANIFIGLGLLTIPYAVKKGGWAALGALGLLVPLFGCSGRLICAAFDCLPPRAPRSYPELGRAAGGRAGQRAVLLFCGLELFGATVMLLMVAWQQLELLLPTEGAPRLRSWLLAAGTSSQQRVPACLPGWLLGAVCSRPSASQPSAPRPSVFPSQAWALCAPRTWPPC